MDKVLEHVRQSAKEHREHHVRPQGRPETLFRGSTFITMSRAAEPPNYAGDVASRNASSLAELRRRKELLAGAQGNQGKRITRFRGTNLIIMEDPTMLSPELHTSDTLDLAATRSAELLRRNSTGTFVTPKSAPAGSEHEVRFRGDWFTRQPEPTPQRFLPKPKHPGLNATALESRRGSLDPRCLPGSPTNIPASPRGNLFETPSTDADKPLELGTTNQTPLAPSASTLPTDANASSPSSLGGTPRRKSLLFSDEAKGRSSPRHRHPGLSMSFDSDPLHVAHSHSHEDVSPRDGATDSPKGEGSREGRHPPLQIDSIGEPLSGPHAPVTPEAARSGDASSTAGSVITPQTSFQEDDGPQMVMEDVQPAWDAIPVPLGEPGGGEDAVSLDDLPDTSAPSWEDGDSGPLHSAPTVEKEASAEPQEEAAEQAAPSSEDQERSEAPKMVPAKMAAASVPKAVSFDDEDSEDEEGSLGDDILEEPNAGDAGDAAAPDGLSHDLAAGPPGTTQERARALTPFMEEEGGGPPTCGVEADEPFFAEDADVPPAQPSPSAGQDLTEKPKARAQAPSATEPTSPVPDAAAAPQKIVDTLPPGPPLEPHRFPDAAPVPAPRTPNAPLAPHSFPMPDGEPQAYPPIAPLQPHRFAAAEPDHPARHAAPLAKENVHPGFPTAYAYDAREPLPGAPYVVPLPDREGSFRPAEPLEPKPLHSYDPLDVSGPAAAPLRPWLFATGDPSAAYEPPAPNAPYPDPRRGRVVYERRVETQKHFYWWEKVKYGSHWLGADASEDATLAELRRRWPVSSAAHENAKSVLFG